MGADTEGLCLQKASSDVAAQLDALPGDPVVKFDFDVSYLCTQKFDLAELKAYCENTSLDINEYAIIQNMDLFEEFGQFGNANFYYAKDWKETKFSADFRQNFGTKEWFGDTETCKIYSNIHY